MNPKINIAIGGKWHFYDIVAAAYEMDSLNTFYTTLYIKNKVLLKSQIGQKLNLKNRFSSYFPSTYVKTYPFAELYPKFLKRVGKINEGEALRMRCEMFDEWVNKNITPCSIFHSQDGFCLQTAIKMKKQGAFFVLDRGIISASYLKELSIKEYGKYGIKKEYADCYIMDRCHQEHLLADCILVPTNTVKQSLISEGIPSQKIEIIPYGVDLDFFKNVGENRILKDGFKILFVGEIGFRKGCHYLLDAWKQLNLKNAELILIGHVEKEFKTYLNQYTGANFRIISYIAQNELKEYYKNASLFILPSLAEGSARVIYEAMACGLPVIYTEMSGSIARNEIDGYEIPAFSTDAICEKISYLYNHKDLCIEMGKQGKIWVQNYSKERYRANIQQVYKKILMNKQ